MTFYTKFRPDYCYRADQYTDEEVCILYALQPKFLQGGTDLTRRLDPDTHSHMQSTSKKDLLREILYGNKCAPGRGKKLFWPLADLDNLKFSAKQLGYTPVVREAVDKYFEFDGLTLVSEGNGKMVKCVAVHFVKSHEEGKRPESDATHMRRIDMLEVGDEISWPFHSKGTKGTHGANPELPDFEPDPAAMLALMAKQYNIWCGVRYGKKTLTIRVSDNRVYVMRVEPERPLPHWTDITWGARKPQTGAFIMKCALKTGVAQLSRAQLSTLRASLYTHKADADATPISCMVVETKALYLSDDKFKLSSDTPPDDACHVIPVVDVILQAR